MNEVKIKIILLISIIVGFIAIARYYNTMENTDQMIDNDIKELQK